ncbi:FecCD family ABC transporter permease [Aureimonas fodinaquatilis]|nr:iron ABC transporter permease [Aureimonas fodinaquatilis]
MTTLTIAGDRTGLGRLVIIICAVLTVVSALASLALGAAGMSVADVLHVLQTGMFGDRATLSPAAAAIVLDIRLPRVCMALAVGAALALSGAMMQGLFRNPLADPGLVGVSSGAALAAVTIIVLGAHLAPVLPEFLMRHLLPFGAFAGAMASTALIYRLSTVDGRTSIATMLLIGIALGALAGAITGILTFISDDQQLRQLTFWSMGGLSGATWGKLLAVLPLMLPAFLAAPFLAKALNRMAMGESEAFHLGVSVQWMKRICILIIAAAVGSAVSVSGTIGFVGLVAPHLIRTLIGPDHRSLLPAAALFGAALLAAADLVARTIVAPAELPIGILTAIIGAPFFLYLLMGRRKMGLM